MLLEQIVFFIAAILALAGAAGVVLLQNPFYSVLSLVGHLVALAVLFLLLSAEFLAAAQVVVYAGAVMVLYVFVTAYVGGTDEPLTPERGAVARIAPLFAAVVFVELAFAIIGSSLQLIDTRGVDIEPGFGSPAAIGELLLGKFLIAFEAASYLLLVTAVGALVLAARRRGLEEEQGGAGAGEATGGIDEAGRRGTRDARAEAEATEGLEPTASRPAGGAV